MPQEKKNNNNQKALAKKHLAQLSAEQKARRRKELPDSKEVARLLLPDAPPSKKKRKVSPVRIACPLILGTPKDPPPRVLQAWELKRRGLARLNAERDRGAGPFRFVDLKSNSPPLPGARKGVVTVLTPQKINQLLCTPSTEIVRVDSRETVANVNFSPSPSTSGVRSPTPPPRPCPSKSTGPESSIHEDDVLEWDRSAINPGSDVEEDEVADTGATPRHSAEFDLEELTAEQVENLVQIDHNDDRALRELASQDMLSFDWSNDPKIFTGEREEFTGHPGPTFSTEGMSPFQVFEKIWDADIINLIVRETNNYGATDLRDSNLQQHSRFKKWTPTTPEELWTFFAVIMLQSIISIAVEGEYWKPCLPYLKIGNFADHMTQQRFSLIKRCLHFVDNSSSKGIPSKLFKIQPIIDHLNNKFSSLYLPEQNIAIDDSLLTWKGRLPFAQLIHTKTARVGIKSYELCESRTGYLWKMIIHTGEKVDSVVTEKEGNKVKSEGATSKIVHYLVRPLLHKGHTLVMDSFYNSPLLSRTLKTQKTDTMGTLRLNREFVPDSLRNISKTNMRTGEVAFSQTNDLTIAVWKDSNVVSLISTFHKVEAGGKGKHGYDRCKPKVVLDYNLFMGSIDKKDQILQAFPVERIRNSVWYKKLFRRLLNVSIHNAFVMFTSLVKMPQRQFRILLADEILNKFRPPPIRSAPISGGHFPGKTQKRKSRCKWCSLKKIDSCTVWKCEACDVNLCMVGCFKEFHHSIGVY